MRDNFLEQLFGRCQYLQVLPQVLVLRYRESRPSLQRPLIMVECPSCHTSNPPDSRLCSKCSTPFGIDSATLVIDATPAPPPDPDATQVFGEVSLAATQVGGTGWSGRCNVPALPIPTPRWTLEWFSVNAMKS